ncbi:hypothetical protein BDR03DRAFT_146750 [Suillus americanus]|nr:hypothetical protein BDR03DRAFT_146750 [Suillus americanus]
MVLSTVEVDFGGIVRACFVRFMLFYCVNLLGFHKCPGHEVFVPPEPLRRECTLLPYPSFSTVYLPSTSVVHTCVRSVPPLFAIWPTLLDC